jgi:ABC-type transport system involved in multi-copper enzyme maturation permease subunit
MLGPIFVRECLTLPRRSNHYAARTVYFGVLWVLALTAWQAAVGWDQSATLGDQARFNLLLFQVLAYVQLVLLLFFAALAAASSITTEKDRRTFVLLLMTDLRNHEIVLGKLLGSLLQIFLLLLGTLAVMALLLFLGGVDGNQVVQVAVVLAASALAAGSLGTLIALWRDKTFQALALTVLFLVLYLCLVHALSALPALVQAVTGADMSTRLVAMIQEWLEPFLALHAALEPETQGWPVLAQPYLFGLSMLAVSTLLNLVSIWRLRAWNPRGEPIIHPDQLEAQEKEKAASVHAAPGKVRPVWANPILWREIATRGYGRRPLLVKLAYFLVVGLICYYSLAPILRGEAQTAWAAAYGLVPVTILSLLLICAQAVTAITSERDLGALDLLLVTDLTAHEFIFGKLLGILWNTKEFLLPPLALAIFYGIYGKLAIPPEPGRSLEATFSVVVAALVFMAFTLVLGVYVALRTQPSRMAIANALGTVFFLSVGTLVCIWLIIINGRFEYQWLSFIFFLAAGVGGLWWVLCGARPSTALNIASALCPVAVFYSITNLLIGKPGSRESADPILPFLVITASFGFAVAAMLVPLLSEFDVAMGRTTGEAD